MMKVAGSGRRAAAKSITTHGTPMNTAVCASKLVITALAAGIAIACQAGQGLTTPQPDAWWPHWQARLSLQAAPLMSSLPYTDRSPQGGLTAQRGVQGGALLGDYYFARPLMGQLRASGGLLFGHLGGAPLGFATGPAVGSVSALPARLGLSLLGGPATATRWSASEGTEPVPYVGLGYAGSWWRDSLSLTADFGMVSERPAAAGSVGRAVFGNQGVNQALRDMRLSPVLQLGMRYAF
jgi:hypothetical protein